MGGALPAPTEDSLIYTPTLRYSEKFSGLVLGYRSMQPPPFLAFPLLLSSCEDDDDEQKKIDDDDDD